MWGFLTWGLFFLSFYCSPRLDWAFWSHPDTVSKKPQREFIPFLKSCALLSLGREIWIYPLDVLVWTTSNGAGQPCGIIWCCWCWNRTPADAFNVRTAKYFGKKSWWKARMFPPNSECCSCRRRWTTRCLLWGTTICFPVGFCLTFSFSLFFQFSLVQVSAGFAGAWDFWGRWFSPGSHLQPLQRTLSAGQQWQAEFLVGVRRWPQLCQFTALEKLLQDVWPHLGCARFAGLGLFPIQTHTQIPCTSQAQ